MGRWAKGTATRVKDRPCSPRPSIRRLPALGASPRGALIRWAGPGPPRGEEHSARAKPVPPSRGASVLRAAGGAVPPQRRPPTKGPPGDAPSARSTPGCPGLAARRSPDPLGSPAPPRLTARRAAASACPQQLRRRGRTGPQPDRERVHPSLNPPTPRPEHTHGSPSPGPPAESMPHPGGPPPQLRTWRPGPVIARAARSAELKTAARSLVQGPRVALRQAAAERRNQDPSRATRVRARSLTRAEAGQHRRVPGPSPQHGSGSRSCAHHLDVAVTAPRRHGQDVGLAPPIGGGQHMDLVQRATSPSVNLAP